MLLFTGFVLRNSEWYIVIWLFVAAFELKIEFDFLKIKSLLAKHLAEPIFTSLRALLQLWLVAMLDLIDKDLHEQTRLPRNLLGWLLVETFSSIVFVVATLSFS